MSAWEVGEIGGKDPFDGKTLTTDHSSSSHCHRAVLFTFKPGSAMLGDGSMTEVDKGSAKDEGEETAIR